MKLAIVGLGQISKFQLEALSTIEDISLVGAHDIDPDKAESLPDSVPFYDSIDSLLTRCEADLILVSTPNITHYELGKRVLESGHPLLLEKPCCQTEQEFADLIRLSEKNDVFFAVALHAAYARDLNWYLMQLKDGVLDYGPITSFQLGFFDPYYEEGKLKPSAESLGGSWFDSGINALSVLCKFIRPENLTLTEGRMTRISALPCSEVQGSAAFTYLQDSVFGHGTIETNWTLGLNRKITRLYYCGSNTHVTLHHSAEKVLVHQNGELILDPNLQNGFPRLTNHYINLFQDIKHRFETNNSNLDYAVEIHKILFAAGKQPAKSH